MEIPSGLDFLLVKPLCYLAEGFFLNASKGVQKNPSAEQQKSFTNRK